MDGFINGWIKILNKVKCRCKQKSRKTLNHHVDKKRDNYYMSGWLEMRESMAKCTGSDFTCCAKN